MSPIPTDKNSRVRMMIFVRSPSSTLLLLLFAKALRAEKEGNGDDNGGTPTDEGRLPGLATGLVGRGGEADSRPASVMVEVFFGWRTDG